MAKDGRQLGESAKPLFLTMHRAINITPLNKEANDPLDAQVVVYPLRRYYV